MGSMDIFLDTSVDDMGGGGCMDCDLGPPPDIITALPPPPLPFFMRDSVAGNDSCDLCDWAMGNGVGYVELPRKGPVIDDTWFFVIISSCIGVTLLGIILALAFLKLRETRLKTSEIRTPSKCGSRCYPLERCETVLYPTSTFPPTLPDAPAPTRALWAGIKTSDNHYTVDHLQPVDQKVAQLQGSGNYDYVDYGSVGYTTITPGSNSGYPVDTSREDEEPYYATMEGPLEGSFENGAYVDSDESAEMQRQSHAGGHIYESYPMKTVRHAGSTPASPKTLNTSSLRVSKLKFFGSLERRSPRTMRKSQPIVSSPAPLQDHQLPPLNLQRHPSLSKTSKLVNKPITAHTHPSAPPLNNLSHSSNLLQFPNNLHYPPKQLNTSHHPSSLLQHTPPGSPSRKNTNTLPLSSPMV